VCLLVENDAAAAALYSGSVLPFVEIMSIIKTVVALSLTPSVCVCCTVSSYFLLLFLKKIEKEFSNV
jgi:hypothetical protein